MQGLGAVAIFVIIVFTWRAIYVKRGSIEFWQLVSSQPDAAFQWMSSRSDWVVLRPDDTRVDQLKQSPSLIGPFKLGVPSVGGTVVMFAERKSIDASQREFMKLFGGGRERTDFPWPSALALLYPIIAILYFSTHESRLLPALGYGFASLGYLLFGAGILVGSFRALGFRDRLPTLIAAVAVWLAGTVLSNLH